MGNEEMVLEFLGTVNRAWVTACFSFNRLSHCMRREVLPHPSSPVIIRG